LPSSINELSRNAQYNESPPQLINDATLHRKMKCSLSHYTTTKGEKFHKKTEVC